MAYTLGTGGKVSTTTSTKKKSSTSVGKDDGTYYTSGVNQGYKVGEGVGSEAYKYANPNMPEWLGGGGGKSEYVNNAKNQEVNTSIANKVYDSYKDSAPAYSTGTYTNDDDSGISSLKKKSSSSVSSSAGLANSNNFQSYLDQMQSSYDKQMSDYKNELALQQSKLDAQLKEQNNQLKYNQAQTNLNGSAIGNTTSTFAQGGQGAHIKQKSNVGAGTTGAISRYLAEDMWKSK